MSHSIAGVNWSFGVRRMTRFVPAYDDLSGLTPKWITCDPPKSTTPFADVISMLSRHRPMN